VIVTVKDGQGLPSGLCSALDTTVARRRKASHFMLLALQNENKRKVSLSPLQQPFHAK